MSGGGLLLGVVIVAFAAIWILGAIFSLFEAAQGKEVSGMKNGLTLAVGRMGCPHVSGLGPGRRHRGGRRLREEGLRRLPRRARERADLAPAAGSNLPVGRRHAGDDGDGAHGLAAKLPPRENHAQYRARARRLAECCRLYSQPRIEVSGLGVDQGPRPTCCSLAMLLGL